MHRSQRARICPPANPPRPTVVLPMAVRRDNAQTLRELLPEPGLAAAAAAIGHAHVSIDEDGIGRSVYLHEGFDGRRWPHFALALKAGITVA